MKDFFIKQHDTFPAIEVEVKKDNGRPYDLSGVFIAKFAMRNSVGKTIFRKDAVVIDEENGVLQYIWDSEDTAVVGDYEGEFTLIFHGGDILTVPTNGFIDIKIVENI